MITRTRTYVSTACMSHVVVWMSCIGSCISSYMQWKRIVDRCMYYWVVVLLSRCMNEYNDYVYLHVSTQLCTYNGSLCVLLSRCTTESLYYSVVVWMSTQLCVSICINYARIVDRCMYYSVVVWMSTTTKCIYMYQLCTYRGSTIRISYVSFFGCKSTGNTVLPI